MLAIQHHVLVMGVYQALGILDQRPELVHGQTLITQRDTPVKVQQLIQVQVTGLMTALASRKGDVNPGVSQLLQGFGQLDLDAQQFQWGQDVGEHRGKCLQGQPQHILWRIAIERLQLGKGVGQDRQIGEHDSQLWRCLALTKQGLQRRKPALVDNLDGNQQPLGIVFGRGNRQAQLVFVFR